jgi:primosomal protein N' (replication factor Y) (superfamily II helicase)
MPIGAAAGPPELAAEVVVPLAVPLVFSYTVPPEFTGRLRPGQRVRVPLRGRARTGVGVGLGGAPPGRRLEGLEAVLDPVPALPEALVELGRWVAEETVSAWGEVLGWAMPPVLPRSAPSLAPATVPPDPAPAGPGRIVLGYGRGRHGLVEAAIERALGEGAGVLLLAPELETARGWADRLGGRLGTAVASLTSEAPSRRRWETWWALRRGTSRLCVGTRSAAFAPVRPLGAIVVVDEHDPAHKGPGAPRWHARELAIRRAEREGGTCLLASGAPSLESWVRVQGGGGTAEEWKDGGWPTVHRVDLRTADPGSCLTRELRGAVADALGSGQSALLILNGLGYGRALGCAECGAVQRCLTCRVAATYHLRRRALTCRLCGAERPAPSLCPRCRGRRLCSIGWGTERLEAEARGAFPGVPVGRYDGSLSVKEALAVREAFRARRVRLLVGTRMALKLLADAPVAVAALALADGTLGLPDFRAGERTFQLAWHLAEGLGPGGSLWLQSFYPGHPALEAVAQGTREAFYRREWEERQELGYPPARRMARVLVEGSSAARLAAHIAERCRGTGLAVPGVVARPGGRWALVAFGGVDLPQAVSSALAPFRGHRRVGAVRLSVEVDPVELP